jgi:CheY-like chemotaxis protein
MIRVLLAEDQHMVRGALAALLAFEPDLEVVAQVAAGDKLVPAALQARPDVALLDIEMSGMNGIEAAARLREELPDCRVLILTTFGRPAYLRQGVRESCVALASMDMHWRWGRRQGCQGCRTGRRASRSMASGPNVRLTAARTPSRSMPRLARSSSSRGGGPSISASSAARTVSTSAGNSRTLTANEMRVIEVHASDGVDAAGLWRVAVLCNDADIAPDGDPVGETRPRSPCCGAPTTPAWTGGLKGRRIFENIRRFGQFLFSWHLSVVLVVVASIVLGEAATGWPDDPVEQPHHRRHPVLRPRARTEHRRRDGGPAPRTNPLSAPAPSGGSSPRACWSAASGSRPTSWRSARST